ncbi:MAG: NADH-quinone oxidoreductase subunit NuoG [Candidatus Eremiobacteraeota bacterium]|nr:NADH-quinone oxidoreductase subunit NuoG [Candidatus Eremiobacteraeota bacterium]
MSEDLVNITIDGHPIAVPKGTLLVEAARKIGLEIPVYCYHPKMKPVGACRVCVVEVEGQRRPIMTACTTTVMPDMVVHTKSENAIKAREGILEFLLINHPLDCPVCDRGGECDLQDFTLRYGPPTTRFVEEKRHFEKSKRVGKNVVLDRERCIMCQRCVRFCDEIAMEEGLVIIERGNRSEIGTFEGRSFDSKFSGNVIELCPVGALTAASYRFESRPWELQNYAGICNQSSLGTNITFDVRYDKIVRIRSRINEQIDDGWLTDATRYSHLEIHSEDRLLKPQIRNEKGDLEEASWDKALERVATELSKDDISSAILAGSKLSVEDGHSLLKLGRSVLETPHVVFEHAHEQLSPESKVTGQVYGCDQADIILCLGCDPSESHPDFELRIKKGLRARAKLICVGEQPAMQGYADYQATGEPAELWGKLVKAVKKKSKEEESGLRMPGPRPWEAGGSTSQDWKALVKEIQGASKILVVVAGNLHAQGLTEIFADVEQLEWNSAPYGVIHLRDGVNSLGLENVGLVPTWNEETAASYQKALGSFNSTEGKTFQELAGNGKGVVVAVGCDPLSTEGSKKPAFLVVAATHSNASTEKADVVLPLSTWAESNGVFVSTDGTVQFSRQAIVPQGESKPAHEIAQRLVNLLEEEPAELLSPRDLYAEVGRLNPSFAGASYKDFQAPGQVHWSYPQQAQIGMPRPDLSAIPVKNPDNPMWMPTIPTGSRVEEASRLLRGQTYPTVPGQRDPREIAAMLGLTKLATETEQPQLASANLEKREGYIPLRVVPAASAQVTGPTPANRHHEIGVGRHRRVAVPVAQVALADPEQVVEETTVEGEDKE